MPHPNGKLTTPLIRLHEVGKSYPLQNTSSQQLSQVWSRLRGIEPSQIFQALQGVSLEVWPGQSMGLVGVNGAGKSTLLKIIAGVVHPSQGTVERRGRVGALLELGAGFHPDYTGRANIGLACALMGLTREETRDRLDSILAFADIGAHIDQPVKHYSSGMVVRLGFAVATSVVPDVLITDEVLAVGDESFQKKCIAWMERYLDDGGTLLLCSHSMYHIQKLCRQAVWIDKGRVCMLDEVHHVTSNYLAWHAAKAEPQRVKTAVTNVNGIYYVKAWQLACGGMVTKALLGSHEDPMQQMKNVTVLSVPHGGDLYVEGQIFSPDARPPQVAIGIVRQDGSSVYGVVSEMDGHQLQCIDPNIFGFSVVFTGIPLLPGRYSLRVHAMDPEGMRLFDHSELPFDVSGTSRELGVVSLPHVWQTVRIDSVTT
jgi:lipopolysaccharide transport system ATP-binding protein